MLLSYHEVASTMAHEMAHCVHQSHKPEFYKLMAEIEAEHAEFVRTGKLNSTAESDGALSGFNIYGVSTSRSIA